MGNENIPSPEFSEAIGFCLVAVFLIPVFVYIWFIFKHWLDDKCDIPTHHGRYDYYDSAKNTDRKCPIINRAHLVKGMSRSRPPNASFFGRIDGKDVSVEGPYEEEFLNKHEAMLWGIKKKKELLAKLDSK